ncbi:DUF5994 family protein [Pseudonocardia lacus]|uniref:DUF5994 family protein n=1 Tax=Pseudonocardia lacus TaxID=2835865 RepID=UPI001BDDBC34|nr:DUF5994 family protein [Pseudonocardia lacus]
MHSREQLTVGVVDVVPGGNPAAPAAGDGSAGMTPGPDHPTTAAFDDRARLRMRPEGGPPGLPHGVWWPRSRDLAGQLHTMLPEVWDRLGGVEQVVYHAASWPAVAPRMGVRGRVVQLVASPAHAADTISLVGASTGRTTTLLVIPAATARADAEAVLDAATTATGSGIVSRFFRTGDGLPDHPGDWAKARVAEEEHSAGARTGAIRTVAGHAVDAQDCTMLLAMLGLDAKDGTRADTADH